MTPLIRIDTPIGMIAPLLIVCGVGFLILVYSVGYMHGDNGYRRFFSQMDLFIFTMLLLVLSDNYVWLLVGWAGGPSSDTLVGQPEAQIFAKALESLNP